MKRIVSLCPSNTEILFLLGLKDRIVGVDNFSDWPKEVEQLPRCGPDLDIDLDKVKALRPDLVVASLSVPGMEKNIEGLRREGIPHLVLSPKRIEDVADDIRRTGEAAGVGERAERVAERFERRLEEIKSKVPQGRPKPRLYWEWWPKPVFTPGRRNWLNDVSEIVGGVNIFGGRGPGERPNGLGRRGPTGTRFHPDRMDGGSHRPNPKGTNHGPPPPGGENPSPGKTAFTSWRKDGIAALLPGC